MNLRELIEILDERVELVIYDCDGSLRTMHLYDKDYFYRWHKEFLKKKINCIKLYAINDLQQARLAIYLEDYYDINDAEEEI